MAHKIITLNALPCLREMRENTWFPHARYNLHFN
jgi:hypothetical protein